MPFPKQKKPLNKSQEHSAPAATNDPRFAGLLSDPRYRLPSKKHTHTKLDSRFSRILKDDDFQRKASVDRYGRKLKKDAGSRDLKRLYRLEDEDEEDEEEETGEDDEMVRRELKRVAGKYDPARDGGFSGSESSEESESDEDEESEEEDVEEAEIYATEEQVNSIPTGEVSRRIAVVNMDWDNVRAEDLMAVALSFLPPEGRIEDCAVYPSEFGRERMDREEMEGPPKEIFQASKKNKKPVDSDSESEDEDEAADSEDEEERIKKDLLKEDKGEEYNSTALRKYQLDRLRYYYAVITCSSEDAAKAIYDAMDGREYLSSANFFDLRFVPDDVTFDETPRDSCKDIPRDYKPAEFVTDALRHSKVKLTWDADDKQRKEVQKRAFSRKEMDDNDLQAYIGSASSSEGEEDEEEFEDGPDADNMSMMSKSTVNRQAKRDAMRAALGLGAEEKPRKGKKDGPVGNMEISFTPGLSAVEKQDSVFLNDSRDIEETTMERYVRKEKERKAKRKERQKAKREGLDPDQNDENEDAAVGAETEEQAEDLGFDDPFFTDPLNAEKEDKKAKKAQKAAKRAQEATEAEKASAQKAELELLMAGEGEKVQHFDMREIRKAEKAKGKKHKKDKKNKDKGVVVDDNFEMNVEDPRFKRLFENHEFAIDPTNPRFKKTEGMKKLMDEGRKQRSNGAEVVERKKEKRVRSDANGEEVGDLVKRLKKKAKA